MVRARTQYDSILYGYAFRYQWMWYNGIPTYMLTEPDAVTLIVWKDYNCKGWNYIAQDPTGFDTSQVSDITDVAGTLRYYGVSTDIWGTAHDMMNKLQAKAAFSFGGYTVIMSQDNDAQYYGRICRKEDFFYQTNQLGVL